MEWDDLDVVYSGERPMGEETEYKSESIGECPACGNQISAVLDIWEYPVGALNCEQIEEISDSMETGKTQVKEPLVYFFDI